MKNFSNCVARFTSLRDTLPQATEWEDIVREIRGGEHAQATKLYRDICVQCRKAEDMGADTKELDELKRRMRAAKTAQPAFVCSVTLEGGRTAAHVQGYTGFVMVDIDGVGEEAFGGVLARVRQDPHTLLAHTTLSGRGIRVVARTEGEVNHHTFGAAWLAVNNYYARLTGVETDRQCKNATRMSVICHDPDVLYRPEAEPLAFDLPEAGRSKSKRLGRPVLARNAAPVVRRLVEEEGTLYAPGSHNAYVSRCLYWMNRFGVAEEEATAWALTEFADYEAAEHSVAATARSCYALTAEHATCHLSRYARRHREPQARPARATVEEMERFIASWGELRRNTLIHQTEVKRKAVKEGADDGGKAEAPKWEPLTDMLENSLWCAMQREGLNTDLTAMRTLIQSDFVPEYHPLREYLESLAPWDGKTDYLGQLFAMVHCRGVSPAEFDFYARRWFVGMLAAALDDSVVNHVILVLLGPQGSFKSSFMENLLPRRLRRYYTSKTNSQRLSKDDLFTMTENLLVNFEEIDSMQRNELNQLKAMTTTLFVNERPAYGRNKVRRPHVASFCATGNNLQFLTDDTGNRRWLPFEVERIDNPWTARIPYEGIYAQAYALLREGFRYWFQEHEVEELNMRNRTFEAPNAAREMVMAYYRKPRELERPQYVTASQIVARFGGQIRLNAVQVGRALKELGFKQVRTHDGNFWAVIERTADEIAYMLPQNTDNTEDNPEPDEPELPF